MIKRITIFVLTVRATLPVRSVSKGASFAFKPFCKPKGQCLSTL